MKSIFDYKDYLDFLKDFFLYKKKENSGFSYTVWSRKMNLKSSSMLSMVVNGERLPSKAFIKNVSKYMKLTPNEEEYFATLVNFKKLVKNPRLTVYLDAESKALNKSDSDNLFVSPMTFIIKELIEAKSDGKIDSKWLNKNLLIKHQKYDLDAILNELLAKEILLKGIDNKLTVKENNLIKVLATKEQIRNFHQANQEMAAQAFDTSVKEERAFHTSFVKLKKDKLEEAKKLIQNFQKELTSFVEEGNGDTILYQVNLQLFPISKVIK
jgi:uncharacterized protein (TIGR02147 family)